jgi:hypothetical protein
METISREEYRKWNTLLVEKYGFYNKYQVQGSNYLAAQVDMLDGCPWEWIELRDCPSGFEYYASA